MKTFFLFCFLTFFSFSCANGNVYSDICKSSRMTYNLYSNNEEYTESYGYTYNLEREIYEFNRYGALSFSVTKSSIKNESGNLNWVKYILVEMQGADGSDEFPRITFAYSEFLNSKNNEISLKTVADSATITRYLKHGDTVFTVSVSGMIPDKAQINNEMCLHANININDNPI